MSYFKIIADSGSTKTDWVIIDDQGAVVDVIKTMGFNPYFHSSEFILSEVEKGFAHVIELHDLVGEIHYYGAGCSSKEKNKIIKDALKSLFPKSSIFINHDLVAAARSTLGEKDGIACILGTGSNSCLWINNQVINNIPSHGYIFGDEGSGSYLGIELLKLYLGDQLEPTLKTKFERMFKLSKDQILNATYKEKSPNVFLAHFATFYTPNIDHPQLKKIMKEGFQSFFNKRVLPYENVKNHKLGFVGSIAFYFSDILHEVANSHNLEIVSISKCPIDNLVEYHANNKKINVI